MCSRGDRYRADFSYNLLPTRAGNVLWLMVKSKVSVFIASLSRVDVYWCIKTLSLSLLTKAITVLFLMVHHEDDAVIITFWWIRWLRWCPLAPACIDMMSKLVQLEAGRAQKFRWKISFRCRIDLNEISMTSFLFKWLILTKRTLVRLDRNYIKPQGPLTRTSSWPLPTVVPLTKMRGG